MLDGIILRTGSKLLILELPWGFSGGSISGQGTRPHMPQLKILHVPANTRCSQINNK